MIKLYFAPRTRSAQILWLLEELGVPDDDHPRTVVYHERLKQRPAFQLAASTEQPLFTGIMANITHSTCNRPNTGVFSMR